MTSGDTDTCSGLLKAGLIFFGLLGWGETGRTGRENGLTILLTLGHVLLRWWYVYCHGTWISGGLVSQVVTLWDLLVWCYQVSVAHKELWLQLTVLHLVYFALLELLVCKLFADRDLTGQTSEASTRDALISDNTLSFITLSRNPLINSHALMVILSFLWVRFV